MFKTVIKLTFPHLLEIPIILTTNDINNNDDCNNDNDDKDNDDKDHN